MVDFLKLLLIPLISAFIGWGTNVIAVKMIFRPKKKYSILGIDIQGLIPKRRHELACTIGEVVEKELISHKDIREIIQSEEMTNNIKELLNNKFDEVINKLLIDIGPLASAFLSGSLIDKVKKSLSEKIISFLPDFMDNILTHLENNISFKETVINKIENFELDKLEEIVLRISSKELKHIEILGGVLGFIIGLVQILIIVGMKLL